MRLPPQPASGSTARASSSSRFRGKPVRAYEGDTIGSALFAAGQRVFSRSFKYHRPRGLLCVSGSCANCMMQVDGAPNVRVCAEPARAGAVVEPQNVIGSLDRDLVSVVDKLGRPFTPVGFYYRTLIRPRRLWPVYEKVLRNLAGLGRVDKHGGRTTALRHRAPPRRRARRRRRPLRARRGARGRGDDGERVLLVDENVRPAADEPFELVAPGRALGVYEGGLVPVEAGNVLLRVRAERIVVATGAVEQPLVFPGNDLVGVMLPDGALRADPRLRPQAGRARGRDRRRRARARRRRRSWHAPGVHVVTTVDLREREPAAIAAEGKRGVLTAVTIDGVRHECDLLLAAGTPQPAYSLLAQAGARVEYDAGARHLRPAATCPTGVEAVGRVTGELGPVVPTRARHGEDGFVCVCEDVGVKD